MLQDVVQSYSKTNRADLCRPPLPPVHPIYFVKSRFELYFRFFILIAGRINIGQLTLSSLFFICLLSVALRFMFVLDYVQHDVSNFVSNNIVCKTTSGEAEHQRFAFCSGAFVYASQLLD